MTLKCGTSGSSFTVIFSSIVAQCLWGDLRKELILTSAPNRSLTYTVGSTFSSVRFRLSEPFHLSESNGTRWLWWISFQGEFKMLNLRGSFFGRGITHAIKTNWRRESKAHAKHDFSGSDCRRSEPSHSLLLIMQLAHVWSVRFVSGCRFVAFSCDCEQSDSFFFLGFFPIFVKANEGEIWSQVYTGGRCVAHLECRAVFLLCVLCSVAVTCILKINSAFSVSISTLQWRCWNLARTSPPPLPPPLCLIDSIALYQKILNLFGNLRVKQSPGTAPPQW